MKYRSNATRKNRSWKLAWVSNAISGRSMEIFPGVRSPRLSVRTAKNQLQAFERPIMPFQCQANFQGSNLEPINTNPHLIFYGFESGSFQVLFLWFLAQNNLDLSHQFSLYHCNHLDSNFNTSLYIFLRFNPKFLLFLRIKSIFLVLFQVFQSCSQMGMNS